MFLILPFSLIVLCLVGILAVVLRKKNYLNKLYTLNTAGNSGNSGQSLNTVFSWKKYWEDFFPEIKSIINSFEFHKYKSHWLIEAEKFFRKTRVVSLKIDRWSDLIIKKIRKIHVNNKLNDANKNTVSEQVIIDETISGDDVVDNSQVNHQVHEDSISPVFLKNEEERLILEIAKKPKDAKLYEELGDIYIEMKGFTDAKESYEAAIELNPQDESLKQKLSLALEKVIQK